MRSVLRSSAKKILQSELLDDLGTALHPADVDRPAPGPHEESEESFLRKMLCRSLLRMDTKAVAHKRWRPHCIAGLI